jgi:hypothetical protein
VGFVVDKVALGQVFLQVLCFFTVIIIPPLLHVHSCIIWDRAEEPMARVPKVAREKISLARGIH